MLDLPQILQTQTQTTAFLHLTIPREEIQHEMGPGLRELHAAVAAQGIEVTGPWFTHHLKITPEEFDFEITLPVSAPVQAAGRVQPGEWLAMKVVRTVYRGGFEGLGEAWGELDEWIETRGLQPAEDLWERYLVGPEESDRPEDWQTELNRPLVG